MMRLSKTILATLAITTIGAATSTTTASAYSKTKTVPTAIRGYYESPSANLGLMITGHRVVQAIPAADASNLTVTSVNRSGHKYAIHGYTSMGGIIHQTIRLSHYKKNKLYGTYAHGYFTKVSKATYFNFLNPFG